jgi:hypothetical protein
MLSDKLRLCAQDVEYIGVASTLIADTTLTIAKPTGTAEGDLMIAFMSCSKLGGVTWTGDTGWTEIADLGSAPSARIAYKVAGASEGASYTFTPLSPSSSNLSGSILTFRGAAYDTIGTATTTDLTAIPSVTVAQNNSVLICFAAVLDVSITLATPSGMTAIVVDDDATITSSIIATETVNAGATGTKATSASAVNRYGVLVSLSPT